MRCRAGGGISVINISKERQNYRPCSGGQVYASVVGEASAVVVECDATIVVHINVVVQGPKPVCAETQLGQLMEARVVNGTE